MKMKILSEFKKFHWDRYAVRQFSLFYWSMILGGYWNYQKFVKSHFKHLMVKYSRTERVYFRPQEPRNKMLEYVEKNIPDPAFAEKQFKSAWNSYTQSLKGNQKFRNKKLSGLSDKKLAKEFKKYRGPQETFIGATSTTIMFIDKTSAFIQEKILLPRLRLEGRENELNSLMGEISTPNKLIHYLQEELDLIEVAESHGKDFERLLKKHEKKYFAIPFFNTHRAWTREDFLKRIKELKKKGLSKEKERIESNFRKQNKAAKKICKELKLSKKQKRHVNALRGLLYLRAYEELLLSYIEFCFHKTFREVSLRRPVSLNQLRFFVLPEFYDLLNGKPVDLNEVNKREEYSLLIYFRGNQTVLTGREAEAFLKKLVKEDAPKRFSGLLKGQPAMKGKAKGRVKVILHITHLRNFKKGDVLVAPNTDPSCVVAMRKASAIVTDEGGVTCHAAIVSRELKKPCVIGTKYATAFLKDNDLVEVNATEGTVKKVKK